MSIKENNLIPYEGEIKAGQRLIKVGDTFVPVGIGGAFEPGSTNFIEVGSSVFYKCASVDTVNKTWTGYKAVPVDGVYSFEDTLTTGLTYTFMTPVVGCTYTSDALVEIRTLYKGFDPDTLFLLDVDNMVDKIGNFTITTNGEFTRSAGLFGNRLEFPLQQQLVCTSSNVSFGGTEDYTIEYFYTRIGSGDYPYTFSDKDTTIQFNSGNDGTSIEFHQQHTGTVTISSDAFVELNRTRHIVLSRRATDGNWKVWMDGQVLSDWDYGYGSTNGFISEFRMGNYDNGRNNGFAIEQYRISRGIKYATDIFEVPRVPLN